MQTATLHVPLAVCSVDQLNSLVISMLTSPRTQVQIEMFDRGDLVGWSIFALMPLVLLGLLVLLLDVYCERKAPVRIVSSFHKLTVWRMQSHTCIDQKCKTRRHRSKVVPLSSLHFLQRALALDGKGAILAVAASGFASIR